MKLLSFDLFSKTILAFISFSFACSFIYILNDVFDAEKDKLHPRKKDRPIPSGAISKSMALGIAIFLLLLSVGISLFFKLNLQFLFITLLYVVLNVAYTLLLKRINLIELFVVAVNFVLRVLAGCFVIDVMPSHWILVVTFFLSLMLILVKRKSELLILKENAQGHRAVLKNYSLEFLDKLIYISATITVTSYILYSIDPLVIKSLHTDKLMYTSLFVIIGVFRFIQISEGKEYDGEGDPTTILYKDRFTQIIIACWLACVYLLLYVG
jgi:4-hydroxybenzoate polyprenyltransferase